jgi:ATP-dependent DNA ligase
MTLPLSPTIEPQLAKTATELPPEGAWVYEPKWDGFRVIAFVDGGEVFLQSRNGKPLDRYFPELTLPPGRYVLDGEIVIDPGDGSQDFGALQQRIHPAASRVEMLARETPASIVAFDLLAEGDEVLCPLTYDERRERLAAVVADPVELSPMTPDRDAAAAEWLTGLSEGVIAKQADAPYQPGERKGMVKIKRIRTADAVVAAFRFGKEEGTVGSLILGMYDDDGQLHVVGHTSGFTAKQKRELIDVLEPYRTGERGSGEPSRWKSEEELVWEGLRPELVVEIGFDHITGNRIRHGAKFMRWRDDKDPNECHISQLRS